MTDQLTATFSALADPTRRAILSQLATGEQSVTDLAKPYNMTMPAISKCWKRRDSFAVQGLVSFGPASSMRLPSRTPSTG